MNTNRLEVYGASPEFDGQVDYDAGFFLCGYEDRSTSVFSAVGARVATKHISGFVAPDALAMANNRRLYESFGLEIAPLSDDEYADWLGAAIESATNAVVKEDGRQQDGPVRIILDVSSLTRGRLAKSIELLLTVDLRRPLAVDFVYAVANYKKAPAASDVQVCRPVSPYFSSTPSWPDVPSTAILGLGYERHRALGVAEYLDPDEIFVFSPIGGDDRFERENIHANALLMSRPGPKPYAFKYAVRDPLATFKSLEALLHSRRSNRVTLVPMGPKVFALVSLLAASQHRENVSVWRVSHGQSSNGRNQSATGEFVWLRTRFS